MTMKTDITGYVKSLIGAIFIICFCLLVITLAINQKGDVLYTDNDTKVRLEIEALIENIISKRTALELQVSGTDCESIKKMTLEEKQKKRFEIIEAKMDEIAKLNHKRIERTQQTWNDLIVNTIENNTDQPVLQKVLVKLKNRYSYTKDLIRTDAIKWYLSKKGCIGFLRDSLKIEE